MRWKLILPGCVLLFIMMGCAPTTHFGIPNKAITAPPQFGETEAAIASAERSEGAKYCPEKIAKAKEMGKQAAEIYWICRTAEAMNLLAQARDLAKQAESCQPPPPPPPPPPAKVIPPPPPPPPPPAVKQPISFYSVTFDFGKSDLTSEARAELDLQKVNVLLGDDERLKKIPVVLKRITGTTEDEIKADIEELKTLGLFEQPKGDGTPGNGSKDKDPFAEMRNKAAQGSGKIPPAAGAKEPKKFSRSQIKAMSKEEYKANREDIMKATAAGLITNDEG